MKNNIFSFVFLLLLINNSLSGGIDLEDSIQKFVVETFKLNIPKEPFGFNPSIVAWKDRLLMSFRCIPDEAEKIESGSSATSLVKLVQLDKNFKQISDVQTLMIPDLDVHAEDARLIMINQRLYIVYCGNGCNADSGGFRMYIAEIDFDGKVFTVIDNECLNFFEGVNKNRTEKNWVPFDYHGHLLLAYGLVPHKILNPLLDGSNACETFACSHAAIEWNWGEMRGGTPAQLINDHQYLAFFHSSKPLATEHSQNQTILHYFMGAYTFSSEPPFEIEEISPEPIIGKNFYHGETYIPYWHPVRVVFPCGFIVDEKYIWVSYGRQDHEIWIAKLDKKALLESLEPVSTLN